MKIEVLTSADMFCSRSQPKGIPTLIGLIDEPGTFIRDPLSRKGAADAAGRA
jgi:hypothetical protein